MSHKTHQAHPHAKHHPHPSRFHGDQVRAHKLALAKFDKQFAHLRRHLRILHDIP